jgi:lipoprotein-releasing system ATP-binding protein
MISTSSAPTLITAKNLRKSYPQGAGELEILKDIGLEIKKGEALCIVGASGAGKSTLLQILGTLDRPTHGELFFEGQDLLGMKDEELSRFRNEKMGFVFQFHHLLSEFSALENVMIPLRVAGENKAEAEAKAADMLQSLGLSERLKHYPSELSGGELQRVAIARALIRRPQILFADEPTGNLDSANGAHVQELFFQLKESFGLTLVAVTHDPSFARKFTRTLRISDGRWA